VYVGVWVYLVVWGVEWVSTLASKCAYVLALPHQNKFHFKKISEEVKNLGITSVVFWKKIKLGITSVILWESGIVSCLVFFFGKNGIFGQNIEKVE
jgi:hypothetical protein